MKIEPCQLRRPHRAAALSIPSPLVGSTVPDAPVVEPETEPHPMPAPAPPAPSPKPSPFDHD